MVADSHTIIADEAQIQHLCRLLASQMRGTETILLMGALGMGKTTFARALIQTLCGEATEVASPTFMLLQEYDAQAGFRIQHYDLYRVEHTEELLEIGLEDNLGSVLMLVEWPEVAAAFFPPSRLEVTFDSDDTAGMDRRRLQLAAKGDMVGVLDTLMRQWEQKDL